jgi:hypothetical protein
VQLRIIPNCGIICSKSPSLNNSNDQSWWGVVGHGTLKILFVKAFLVSMFKPPILRYGTKILSKLKPSFGSLTESPLQLVVGGCFSSLGQIDAHRPAAAALKKASARAIHLQVHLRCAAVAYLAMGQSASALQVSDGHDLAGKVSVITGASSGIGKEAAKVLLFRGSRLVMPVRSLVKGEAVKKELLDELAAAHALVVPPDRVALFQVPGHSCAFRSRLSPLPSPLSLLVSCLTACSANSHLSSPSNRSRRLCLQPIPRSTIWSAPSHPCS